MMSVIKAVFLALMISFAAQAGEIATTSEFGRVSGGQIEVRTRASDKMSGSLGMTMSTAGSERKGYEATLGGTVLEDRLWFFAAGSLLPSIQLAQSDGVAVLDTKMIAHLGDRNTLAATFSQSNITEPRTMTAIPSSFLSLRYSGSASNHLFFSATFLRRSSQTP